MMPVDTLKHSLRIHRNINRRVLHNIARLWQLGQQAKTHQELLDGLHPWGDHPSLKFNNVLPVMLMFAAGTCALATFIFIQQGIFAGLCLLTACALGFAAYVYHEPQTPLQEVVSFLRQQVLEKKYQLRFQELPTHFPDTMQPFFLLARLKNLFPVFEQGTVSNMLPVYASTCWQDQHGQSWPVMLFQYDFIHEVSLPGQSPAQGNLKRTQKSLWGIFIFEQPAPLGLAVTTTHKEFDWPYQELWQTSDIQINQKLRIYGHDALQLAKIMTPAMALRLNDFFTARSGDLLWHSEQNILCFLTEQNLFKMDANRQNITDISKLRGHLRTFRLSHYEQLEQDLKQLLQ